MQANPLQFAVVREDPRVEFEVLERHPARRALLVASGGCTALALAARRPELELTLVDPNPAQLQWVERKVEGLANLDRAEGRLAFNIDCDDPQGLSEAGNFEALFRSYRRFLFEFAVERSELESAFRAERALEPLVRDLLDHPYWPVAHAMHFGAPLLEAMFGPDATQHAEPGSYPDYFRRVFERGLTRPDARDNPFLHHVFLGHYLDRPGCLPEFLARPPRDPRYVALEQSLGEVEDFGRYDFIGLSNVMDWMGPEDVAGLLGRLRAEARPGATVLWRQLNNDRDLQEQLAPEFRFDRDLQVRLHRADRSLFYSSLHVGHVH